MQFNTWGIIPYNQKLRRNPAYPWGHCITIVIHRFEKCKCNLLGARLRGRTATQRSKKGSEKVLERVLGKGSQKGSEKGVCYGFQSRKGF